MRKTWADRIAEQKDSPIPDSFNLYEWTPVRYEYWYGSNLPVWKAKIEWSCGHSADIETAAVNPPGLVKFDHDCPECYTGEYGNVYD